MKVVGFFFFVLVLILFVSRAGTTGSPEPDVQTDWEVYNDLNDRCKSSSVSKSGGRVAYYLFGNECYIVYKQTKTWSQARDVCKQYGGDLLSVSNGIVQRNLDVIFKEKNSQIVSSKRYWIGFSSGDSSNVVDAGKWRWTDGSPFIYRHFEGSGDSRGGGFCGYVRGNRKQKWESRICDQANDGYVCVAKLGQAKTYIYQKDEDIKFKLDVGGDTCKNINEKVSLQYGGGWPVRVVSVPANHELTLFSGTGCSGNGRRHIIQGPALANVYWRGSRGGHTEIEHGWKTYKLRRIEFLEYPLGYYENNMKNVVGYLTQTCKHTALCFRDILKKYGVEFIAYWASGVDAGLNNHGTLADNKLIYSLDVPFGKKVKCYEKVGVAGAIVQMIGLSKVSSLEEENYISRCKSFTVFDEDVDSVVMEVGKLLFDEKIVVGSNEPEEIDEVVLENPSSETQTITISKTYVESTEENWFQNREDYSRFEYHWDIEVEISIQPSKDHDNTFGRFMVTGGEQHETSYTNSRGTGGSIVNEKSKTVEFTCVAPSFTIATCVISQKKISWLVPYEATTTVSYGNTVVEETFVSMMRFEGIGKAFLETKEEKLVCNDEGEELNEGFCYKAIFPNSPVNYFSASDLCFESGMVLASANSQMEAAYIVHELCGIKRLWLGGISTVNGKVEWEDGSSGVYTRWYTDVFMDPHTDELNRIVSYGDEGLGIYLNGVKEGFWLLREKESNIASCVPCKRPLKYYSEE